MVVISTETGSDIIAEAMSLGAAGSIKKPFTPDMINATVGSFM